MKTSPVLHLQACHLFESRPAANIIKCAVDSKAPTHLQMLKEYKDIDIALDPFPFSGGATSCEALYMGVPVITWPHNQVVSRQTAAFVQLIGHPEWAVDSAAAYIEKAKQLAEDKNKLSDYRATLRDEVIHSPLMQVKQFTQSLEALIHQLYQAKADQAA